MLIFVDNFTDQAISSRGLNGQLGNDRQLQVKIISCDL